MNILTALNDFYDYSICEKNFSPRTVIRYRNVLNFFCSHARISKLEDITFENVKELFYYGRKKRHWSTHTYLNYHKTLNVFFRWCIKNKYLKENPVDRIDAPKLEQRLPRALTIEEVVKLFKTIKSDSYNDFLRVRNLAIFAVLVFTGIRKQELLDLKFRDVDVTALALFIRQGKGNKDRIIPMSPRLADMLRPYLVWRGKLNKSCEEFFASYTYDQGITATGLKLLISSISKKSGVKFTAHTLRHTFATLLLEGGCDIYYVSKFLGHTDIKTTVIYLGTNIKHLRIEIAKHPLEKISF